MSTETEDLIARLQVANGILDCYGGLHAEAAAALSSSMQEVETAKRDRDSWEGMYDVAARRAVEAEVARDAASQEVERLRAEAPPCDGGCNANDGPDETCSAHGRPVADVWEIVNRIAGERDAAEAEREASISGGSAVVLAEMGRLQQEARTAREAQTIAQRERDTAVAKLEAVWDESACSNRLAAASEYGRWPKNPYRPALPEGEKP